MDFSTRPISSVSIYTLGRHIVQQEKECPSATGALTTLLWDLTIAFKIISNEVNRAGLVDILGFAGHDNVHGEQVRKLDTFANSVICRAMDHGGHLCVMASEESPEPLEIPDEFKKGKYVLVYDPLDGSSNIDANVSVGTIFSILKRKSLRGKGKLSDCLQAGVEQVAAGYVVYGSSTMLVYSTGRGVFGFTLDPTIGEFVLSHSDITTPEAGSVYSVNEGNSCRWDLGTQRYIEARKADRDNPASLRYIGSLVADFHRNLLHGGLFLYPADCSDPRSPKPKLRLLYEANPLAFLVEQAGGMATSGRERILEIQPQSLHQKVPLVLGSRRDVETYLEYYRKYTLCV